MCIFRSPTTTINATILRGSLALDGGAITAIKSSVILSHSQLLGNTAGATAGGVLLIESQPNSAYEQVTFDNNHAPIGSAMSLILGKKYGEMNGDAACTCA